MIDKQYIGDGVYADTEDETIVLTTEDGHRITNVIYLEPEVLHTFIRYVVSTMAKRMEQIETRLLFNEELLKILEGKGEP